MEFLKKLKGVFVTKVPDTSAAGTVNSTDVAKVIRTSIYVAVAAGLTFAIENISPGTLGAYGVFIVPAVTAAIEFLNKLAKGNT